ncbi:MAG TPA: L,D-transpeptidase family protein [Polyangia bacterium]|nr:L,D-transpeptidase family protein [Polyangia bacterium]
MAVALTSDLQGPDHPGPTVHVQKKIKLVMYPGESTNASGTTLGHIYVVGGNGESYEIAAGPPAGFADRGGHSAIPTPAGKYVLGPKHHHVTPGWPASTVPWGADLRTDTNGEVEFSPDGGKSWRKATGMNGATTQASIRFLEKDWKRPLTEDEKQQVNAQARGLFYDDTGKLQTPYRGNDFGNWAWNLTRGGAVTPYYLHTTPPDEAASAAGQPVSLVNSHGCVHIRPADRDEMMQKGYLRKGVEIEVKPYGQKGPPKP